jgi:multiple sugar transport system substrate-binding protein
MSYSKKTLWSVIAATMILAMMLAACATPAGQAPQTVVQTVVVEKQVEVTPTAGAAKPLAGCEINFMAGQPQQVADKAIAKWFEDETGARVNVLIVPYPNLTEKATLDVTSGAGEYDVVQYWYPGLGALVANGVVADITDWWNSNADAFQVDDIIPAFLDNYTLVDGKRYGIPLDGDIHELYYNTTIFKKYGITEPPKTWDEYLNICKTITEGEKGSGTYGCGIMASKVPLILIGTFLNRVAGFGGSFMDANGKPVINSPENVAALEHLIKEMPYAIPDPKAVGFDEMLGPWLTGRVGMVEFWTDLGQMTDNPEQSKIPGEWGVAPMPAQGTGKVSAPMNAGWGVGLSTLSKNPECAKAFLAFIMRPETNLKANMIVGGLDPMRKSTFADPAFREFVTPKEADAALTAELSNPVAWPHDAKWWDMQEPLNEALAAALNGDMTPKQALDKVQAQWEQILSSK